MSFDNAPYVVSRDQRIAVRLLKAGQPLPLDLFARLMEQGVDVDELSRRHAA